MLPEQWDKLILQPLMDLDKRLQKGLYPSFILVLVIDALDEYQGEEDLRETFPLFDR
jgi:hypothetical protein